MFDLLFGVILTNLPEFRNWGGLAIDPAFGNSRLDREAMGIPPKNERGLEASHILVTNVEIF